MFRRAYGLAEVAGLLGVAKSSYTNQENGRRCPDALALARLMKVDAQNR